MDHSIVSRATLEAIGKARKVDQRPPRTDLHLQAARKGRSTSVAHDTAIELGERTLCQNLSTFELSNILLNRFDTTNGLEFVDKHTLFKLWIAIDTELQSRKDALEAQLEPFIEDVPARTPFASVVGDDDADHTELEAFAVRSIHAEVFDMSEEE